jgi:hypothetical protein
MKYYLVSQFDNDYRRHVDYIVIEGPDQEYTEKVCRLISDSASTYIIFQVFDSVPRRFGQRDYRLIPYKEHIKK